MSSTASGGVSIHGLAAAKMAATKWRSQERKATKLRENREKLYQHMHFNTNNRQNYQPSQNVTVMGEESHYLDLPRKGCYARVAFKARTILLSDAFNYLVISIILLAGLVVGVQMYKGVAQSPVFKFVDWIVVIVFIVEFILKIIAEYNRPLRYFYGPSWRWNWFDFSVIVVSMPVWGETLDRRSVKLLRLLELLRMVKLVKKIPQLQMIVSGLIGGFRSFVYIMMLLLLMFYVYAIAGFYAFGVYDAFHFGTLGRSMVTLFRIATLEDWIKVFYINFYGCDNEVWNEGFYTHIQADANNKTIFYCEIRQQNAWLRTFSVGYFMSFLIISAFSLLAMFIGAVTMSMSQSMVIMKAEKKQVQKQKLVERAHAEMSRAANAKTRSKSYNRISSMRMSAISGSRSGIVHPDSVDASNAFASFSQGSVHSFDGDTSAHAALVLSEWDLDADDLWKLQTFLDVAWGLLSWEDSQLRVRANFFVSGSFKFIWQAFANRCAQLSESKTFEMFYLWVVLFSGLLLGLQTYEAEGSARVFLGGLEMCTLLLFALEISIKTIARGFRPWRYFYHHGWCFWNIFDYLVLAGCFIPHFGSVFALLRLARIVRLLKMMRSRQQLRIIMQALATTMRSISYIVCIIIAVFYVFAVIGMILFEENDPVNFGLLHVALITLLRCATLDWSEILYINMYGCNNFGYKSFENLCVSPNASFYLSVLYFSIFIIIGSFVLLTLFIGVVTTSMEEAAEEHHNYLITMERVAEAQESLQLSIDVITAYKEMFKMLDLDQSKSLDDDKIAIGFLKMDIPLRKHELKQLVAGVMCEMPGEMNVAEFIFFMETVKDAVVKNEKQNQSQNKKSRFAFLLKAANIPEVSQFDSEICSVSLANESLDSRPDSHIGTTLNRGKSFHIDNSYGNGQSLGKVKSFHVDNGFQNQGQSLHKVKSFHVDTATDAKSRSSKLAAMLG